MLLLGRSSQTGPDRGRAPQTGRSPGHLKMEKVPEIGKAVLRQASAAAQEPHPHHEGGLGARASAHGGTDSRPILHPVVIPEPSAWLPPSSPSRL